MRTIVDIPEEQLARVDSFARRRNWSRAEAVRRGLDKLMEDQPDDLEAILDEAVQAWAHIKLDGLEWQQKLRAEWDQQSPVE